MISSRAAADPEQAVTSAPAATARSDRLFYTSMALAAAAAVFVGFAPTYYLRPRFQAAPLPVYLHVHGFVFSAWVVLFIAQAALVAARRTGLHRRLGWAAAVWAALMVAVGTLAGVWSMQREIAAGFEAEALAFFLTPVSSMATFAALVAAGLVRRRHPETHKRLMLLATLGLLDAAVARWPVAFLAESSVAFYAVTDLFIVAAIAYDAASRRAVSRVYLWGGLLIVVQQWLRLVLGPTEAWQAIARAVLM